MSEQTKEHCNELALQGMTLPAARLNQIGVTEADLPEIAAISRTLSVENALSIIGFGQEAAQSTVTYADQMLEMVNTRDLEDTGTSLNYVLTKAKEINTSGLAHSRSRIPFVGFLVDKFRVRYSSAMAQFGTARQAIDATTEQIKETQSNLEQRIKDLDLAYKHVEVEYHMLGKYIAAGQLASARIDLEINDLMGQDQTQMSVQTISDRRRYINKVEKRVADLTVLQQNALNTLPAIRLVQANNALLIDKYNTIVTLTIPVWKRSMMLGLALEEQAQSVELANQMDDFTNTLLKQQADLLKQNTLATAKANQRLVIDVETINHVQNSLISTVHEVNQIQSKALRERDQAIDKIMALRKELNARLVGAANGSGGEALSLENQVH